MTSTGHTEHQGTSRPGALSSGPTANHTGVTTSTGFHTACGRCRNRLTFWGETLDAVDASAVVVEGHLVCAELRLCTDEFIDWVRGRPARAKAARTNRDKPRPKQPTRRPDPVPDPDWLEPRDAASRLGVDMDELFGLVASGEVVAFCIDERVRFRASDLRAAS